MNLRIGRAAGEFIWTLAERGEQSPQKSGPETDNWEESFRREAVYGRRDAEGLRLREVGGLRLELLDALTVLVQPVGVVRDLAFDTSELLVLAREVPAVF